MSRLQHLATTARRTWCPGEDPADQHARTFAAIEFACLDIIGKAVGKPVCDVIGGCARDEVPFLALFLFVSTRVAAGLATIAAKTKPAKCSIQKLPCAKPGR